MGTGPTDDMLKRRLRRIEDRIVKATALRDALPHNSPARLAADTQLAQITAAHRQLIGQQPSLFREGAS